VISLGQLDDLRTQAALSKAALQTAEFNRGYASIVAPEDGVVLRRLAEERELVAVGTPVLVIGSAARGYVVRVDLIDRDIVQVRKGDAAEVGLDAHPGEKLTAHVTEIASGADPTNGLFKVELRLDPTPLSLASGLVARVTLKPVSVHGERVYVPLASIVEGSGHRASVFVIAAADQTPVARRRAVEVAFIDGDQVALTSGVAAGERVVAEGALYLADGERIRPQDAS
jgi:RND family efflux transporter MFP subunit